MKKKSTTNPNWSIKHSYKKQVPASQLDKKNSMNIAEYDRLILQQGIPIKIYRSMFCPNVKEIDAASHQIDCKFCNGSGIIDINPYESYAYFHSNSMSMQDNTAGRVDGNVVQVTFLADVNIQYFTLVEIDIPDTFYERIKRQEGNKDFLRYKALQINALIDSNAKQYYEGNDFLLDPNGSISWISGRGPAKNTIYSVHYFAKIQFRATRAVHKNRFVQTKIDAETIEIVKANESWELTKEFLVTRRGVLGELLDKNTIEDK